MLTTQNIPFILDLDTLVIPDDFILWRNTVMAAIYIIISNDFVFFGTDLPDICSLIKTNLFLDLPSLK